MNSLRLVSVGKNPITPISFEEAQEIIRAQVERTLEVPVPEGALVDLNNASSTATSTNATSTETEVGITQDAVAETLE
jgi:hypothetical protein